MIFILQLSLALMVLPLFKIEAREKIVFKLIEVGLLKLGFHFLNSLNILEFLLSALILGQ